MRDSLFCIQSGMIIDGTGSPPITGDVWVQGDRIIEIRPEASDAEGRLKVEGDVIYLDARHCVVAPGFIDMHSHSDLAVFRPEGVGLKVQQGVTTELFGQDGLSVAPLARSVHAAWRRRLAGLLGDEPQSWPWESVAEYFQALEALPPEVNVSYLLPHGPIRAAVVGTDRTPATAADLAAMSELIREGMASGARGFSTGLIYPPCSYANREELSHLARAVAEHDGFFVVHMRNEGSGVLRAFAEMRSVAETSGCPVHISHLKVAGLALRHLWPELLSAIDAARADGLDITFDQYPYAAGSTVLDALLPQWVHAGGVDAVVDRLRDPATRQKIRADLLHEGEEENMLQSGGPESVQIAWVQSEANAELMGKTLLDIAEERGVDPVDALMDILIEESCAATMIRHWGDEADIVPALRHEAGMACTDGIYGPHPHPRLYGAFPRLLGHFVRDRKDLTLVEAVHRMTGRSANRLGFTDRGRLKKGLKADIVVFDPERVGSGATYENPWVSPTGIRWVWVNGVLALDEGKLTGRPAGRVLRYGV